MQENKIMYGYAGKMLFVDLGTGILTEEPLTIEMAKNYLSGYGIGAKIMLDRMKANADPLGPDNILGFTTGVLNGTSAAIGGRYTVVCKSPVSNTFNDANSGGDFGAELKKAGFDAVFFTGISQKPTYLYINDGKAELKDATHLWGQDCKEIWDSIKEETGESKVKIAAIGPAGENLSMYACIINDGFRAAGRGGCGTVMGSKKLKAIAVKGTGKIEVADKEKLKSLNKELLFALKGSEKTPLGPYIKNFRAYGTGCDNRQSALGGDSPVKNWSGVGITDFGEENANKVDISTFDEKYNIKKYACNSCILGCGAIYEVNSGKWPIGATERPEYETFAAFGINCLNSDVEAIFKCNEICNRAGMDVISAGSTIAWAMECYEHGVLTAEELDGIKPTWGNAEAIVELTEKIAKNDGCGKFLSLGQKGAAEKLGKGFEFLTVCKGIEPAMHDGRRPTALGYSRMYQFDPTPGRHVKGGAKTKPIDDLKYKTMDISKIEKFSDMPNIARVAYQEMMNAAGVCMFSNMVYPGNWMNEAISAVTGFEIYPSKSFYMGLRFFMLRHGFNIREGFLRKDFDMSPRLLGQPPLPCGPNGGVVVDNKLMGDLFFEGLGCDVETGVPSREILEKIGALDDVMEIIYGSETLQENA
ncbi:MAG: aldehyde ferredoxin oxidoreductase family protein [Sedimentibacter sp.]|uniref:aldehyde ferredoxin oxidoreductase family protein n=1 Tax=Sedimentibacter sp. TaxID=1960295 RepID=UPI0031594DA0